VTRCQAGAGQPGCSRPSVATPTHAGDDAALHHLSATQHGRRLVLLQCANHLPCFPSRRDYPGGRMVSQPDGDVQVRCPSDMCRRRSLKITIRSTSNGFIQPCPS